MRLAQELRTSSSSPGPDALRPPRQVRQLVRVLRVVPELVEPGREPVPQLPVDGRCGAARLRLHLVELHALRTRPTLRLHLHLGRGVSARHHGAAYR